MTDRPPPHSAHAGLLILLPVVLALAFGLLTGTTLVMLPRTAPALIQVEQWPSDLRTAFLSDRRIAQHPQITLVTITDDTLDGLAYREPIDRKVLADLIRTVDKARPDVIGLDLIIDQPTEPAKDEALLAAIHDAFATVVLGEADERVNLRDNQRRYQYGFLDSAGRPHGYLNLAKDGDGVVRSTASPPDGHSEARSFAAVLAKAGGLSAVDSGPRRIAWLLDPGNGAQTFATVPAQLLLSANAAPDTPAGRTLAKLLKGRIVLIGGVFESKDQHQTPLSTLSGRSMPGLLIHAQILAQLIDGRDVASFVGTRLGVLAFLVATLGFYLGLRYRLKRFDFGVTLITGILLVAVDYVLFSVFRISFPYALTLLAWAVAVTVGHYVGAILRMLVR